MLVRKIRAIVDSFPTRQHQPIAIPVMASARGGEMVPGSQRHLLPWADPYIASLQRQLERDSADDRRDARSQSRHPGRQPANRHVAR